MLSRRMKRRLARHHLPLALGTAIGLALTYSLVHSPNPVSTDLRRDVGIWAGVLAVAHFLIGWQVHMPHRYLYWLQEVKGSTALRPRTDLFGFANYTGLAAVIIAVLLLALSNDYFLRRLQPERWKRLQRWNYALFALVLIHGIAVQVIETRKAPFVIALSLLAMASLVLQLEGFRRRRRASRDATQSARVRGGVAA